MEIRKSILTRMLMLVSVVVLTMIETSCTTSRYSTMDPHVQIDPVCNMTVKKDTAFTYAYNGRTYYFDSKECLAVFKKNPGRFMGDHQKPFRHGRMAGMHGYWWVPAAGVIMVIGMTAAMIFGTHH